jgi:hypothetical protein
MLCSSSLPEKLYPAVFVAVLSFFLLCPTANSIGDAFIQPTDDSRIVSSMIECWCDYDESRYTLAVAWTVNPSQPPSYTGKGLSPHADAPLLYKKLIVPALRETRAPPSFS